MECIGHYFTKVLLVMCIDKIAIERDDDGNNNMLKMDKTDDR